MGKWFSPTSRRDLLCFVRQKLKFRKVEDETGLFAKVLDDSPRLLVHFSNFVANFLAWNFEVFCGKTCFRPSVYCSNVCVWYSIFARWWFQSCFIFTPTSWNLQFFKWVETTKYIVCMYPPVIYRGWKLPLFQIENTSSKGPCVVAVFECPEGMYVCLYIYI